MRRARSLTAGFALVAAVVAMVAVQHHRHTRATVGKVADAATGAPYEATSVVVGGRTFRIARYHRAHGVLTTAIADDSRGLNDGTVAVVRSRPAKGGGDVQLSWSGSAHRQLRVRFVRDGHQVVIVGSPATEPVRRAMSRLAGSL